ncbi:MAG: hypothetical protein AB7U76_24325 [Pirellulales bacterium]
MSVWKTVAISVITRLKRPIILAVIVAITAALGMQVDDLTLENLVNALSPIVDQAVGSF